MTTSTLNNQKGAAAVEFAIILPLLVVFIFGIIEFSVLFYNKAMITNASREGARAAIVFETPSLTLGEIETLVDNVVDNYCQNALITFGAPSFPDADVVCNPIGNCDTPGDILTVNVSYHYDFLVLPNFIGGLLPGMDLTARTAMRME